MIESMRMCMRMCMCVRACVHVCVCARACVRVRVPHLVREKVSVAGNYASYAYELRLLCSQTTPPMPTNYASYAH